MHIAESAQLAAEHGLCREKASAGDLQEQLQDAQQQLRKQVVVKEQELAERGGMNARCILLEEKVEQLDQELLASAAALATSQQTLAAAADQLQNLDNKQLSAGEDQPVVQAASTNPQADLMQSHDLKAANELLQDELKKERGTLHMGTSFLQITLWYAMHASDHGYCGRLATGSHHMINSVCRHTKYCAV